jgi:CRP-like cAMP-binding protein
VQGLFDHINNYTTIDENEFEKISSYFQIVSVGKKEAIYSSGNKPLKHYFILDGCAQMYFIKQDGSEQTVQFALKNWWITDYLSFQNKKSSEFYIKSVEPTTYLQIGYEQQEVLLEQFPKMETYFRTIFQIAYGASLMRIKYIYSYSKEEIYFHFRDAFPEFINAVPQYLIASYLGLSPEYLSKIRKKDIS